MGLSCFVPEAADRLPTVTSACVPDGVDDMKVRKQLLAEFGIEIAGGFGPLKGKMWRLGLMGFASQSKNVLLLLAALEKCLLDQGFRTSPGAGVGAAVRRYAQSQNSPAGQPVAVGARK
jgi:alanine-glyoxylate transaminase/serine-glyoxylate transaminase/serine-pyruvate transaminase